MDAIENKLENRGTFMDRIIGVLRVVAAPLVKKTVNLDCTEKCECSQSLLWRGTQGWTLGEGREVGGIWEAGEERVGSGIPKVVGEKL